MKNVFDRKDVGELVARIDRLTPNSQPLWGKMNVAQMLAHCNVTYELAYDNKHPRPNPLVRFLLRLFVKGAVVGEKPYGHNSRTAPVFLVTDERNFAAERARLIGFINTTLDLGEDHFDHRESHSFGALTKTEWSTMLYKHLDHHLRQFAAVLFGLSVLAAAAPAQAPPREDGQWTMPGKDYGATRYSGLAKITAANAAQLKPVWTFSTGVLRGHEGQPLVVGNLLYVVTPFPNVLYAFDLSQPGYPLKWKYRPDVDEGALGMACCDAINRGAFYAEGKIVYNTLDGHTIAVDATTGREVWNVKVGDLAGGETMPMAPMVVGNRVIVGPSGGEFGIRGWTKALDLATGAPAWTGYNVGSDADMLARPGTFKPFYDQGPNLGLTTWPTDVWKKAGAPVWGWLSYDPALDLAYFGVGNPGPYNSEQRAGDNKWTNSVLARRPGDGSLLWAYQFTPNDNWDYDSNAEMILADLTIKGTKRKALVHFDKNGFAYTMDRTNGEVLLAEPYVFVNWAKKIDLKTGRPVLDSTKLTGASRGEAKYICPSLEGGKSPASPAAYSPRTGLFYLATVNLCMNYATEVTTRLRGTPYIGATTPYQAGPGGNLGAFVAWDATTGRRVWEIKEKFPVWSGVVATAGDVVFYGTLDGWFRAANARTGKVLWSFKVGSGVVAAPITFSGPDGKQYVAVYSGIGGDWALLAGDLRSDDPKDVRDPADYVRELGRHTSQGGMVWVFGL